MPWCVPRSHLVKVGQTLYRELLGIVGQLRLQQKNKNTLSVPSIGSEAPVSFLFSLYLSFSLFLLLHPQGSKSAFILFLHNSNGCLCYLHPDKSRGFKLIV